MSMMSKTVYHTVRRRIFLGEVPPGTPISERTLSEELGVSRTPAREALLKLEHEGLVEVKPRVGYVIRQWSPDEIRARFDLRLAIEGVAVEWAARKMTRAAHRRLLRLCDKQEEACRAGSLDEVVQVDIQFHETLMAASDNKEVIRAASLSHLMDTIFPHPGNPELADMLQSVAEHREIANLLWEKRPAEAKGVLVAHLRRPAEACAAWAEEHALKEAERVAGISGGI